MIEIDLLLVLLIPVSNLPMAHGSLASTAIVIDGSMVKQRTHNGIAIKQCNADATRLWSISSRNGLPHAIVFRGLRTVWMREPIALLLQWDHPSSSHVPWTTLHASLIHCQYNGHYFMKVNFGLFFHETVRS